MAFNPDGTPIQTAPATPAAAAVPATPPAQAPAQAPAPSVIDPYADRGVEGAPHPGEMLLPGQAPAPVPAIQAPVPAVTPPVATPEAQLGAPAALGGVRGQLASLGLAGLERFADDNSALEALAQQAQAAGVLQQQLEAVLRQQQQAAQQAQLQAQMIAMAQQRPAPAHQAPADPFAAPEYNPVWEQLITKDASGVTGVVPGVPADILQKYHTYHAWRKNFADRLLSDPRGTLMPLVAQQAEERAKALVQAEFAKQQTEGFVQNFLAQNTEWLHARGADGQVIVNPANGTPLLSPLGQSFRGHLTAAHQMGITDVRAQERYARDMLRAEYATAQYGQQQQQQQAAAATVAANRRPSAAGTLGAPGLAPVAQNPGLSLREQLAQAFAQAGITDEMLQANLG